MILIHFSISGKTPICFNTFDLRHRKHRGDNVQKVASELCVCVCVCVCVFVCVIEWWNMTWRKTQGRVHSGEITLNPFISLSPLSSFSSHHTLHLHLLCLSLSLSLSLFPAFSVFLSLSLATVHHCRSHFLKLQCAHSNEGGAVLIYN